MSLPNQFYFDVIILKITKGAAWRRTCAARHGDDRNIEAADLLARLARSKFSDVHPEAWDALAPHLDCDYFNESLNEAVRAVGFRARPLDINGFLALVADTARGFALPANLRGAA